MVYSVDIYDKSGKVVSNVDLNETLFADTMINPALIHEYYLLQSSNARLPIAKVQGKWEVAGSGRKLYKQKGTGNARSGWKNSPTRKGGGVAFGPRWEVAFEKWMNKKARKVAIYGLLTLKAKDKQICGLKDLEMKGPKTKDATSILKNLGLDGKKVLLVMNKKDEAIEKSFRNLQKVKYLLVDYLNPFDLMNADKVVLMESALEKINEKK